MKRIFNRLLSYDIITIFSFKPYLYFLSSVAFSQVAFNMMNVLMLFLIFNLTGSNFLVSLLLLISLLPQVFLSFVGGVIADTKNKKNILVYINILRACIVGLLFFMTDSPILVYLIAFSVSVATQFYIPAEAPIIPKLVPEKFLIAANSLFGLALFGSILIGFIVAGPSVIFLGQPNSFLVIVGLFLLAALSAHLISSKYFTKDTVSEKSKSPKMVNSITLNLIESYKVLRNTENTTSSFLLLILSQVVIFILAIIVPGYASSVLKIHVEDVSFLLFAPAAVGMILAAVLIATVFEKTNRDILMNIGMFLSGIALFTFPLFPQLYDYTHFQIFGNIFFLIIITAFFGGVGNACIFIPAQATIQEKIPEHFRSKIYGLLFAAIGFFSLLPMIIAGGLADTLGVNIVLYIIGLIIIICAVIQFLVVKTAYKK